MKPQRLEAAQPQPGRKKGKAEKWGQKNSLPESIFLPPFFCLPLLTVWLRLCKGMARKTIKDEQKETKGAKDGKPRPDLKVALFV